MGYLKILVIAAVAVGLLMMIPVFFIYMASDSQNNITVGGSYSGLWIFMNDMNVLLATIFSNLGYVLAILIVIMLIVAGIAILGTKIMYG